MITTSNKNAMIKISQISSQENVSVAGELVASISTSYVVLSRTG